MCPVFIGQITPCFNYYGSSAAIETKRVAVNDAIAGNGGSPITNVAGRVTSYPLDLGNGAASPSLSANYDVGDNIHPNFPGHAIIDLAFKTALLAAGYLT